MTRRDVLLRLLCWLPILAAAAPVARGDAPARPPPLLADQGKPPPATAPAAGPTILDDVPQPLVPEKPRTESDRDRVEAMAQFAAGRMHERRGEDAEALRLYERALRGDPQSVAVVRSIIPLAFRLKRHGEAIRYSLKAVEIDDADPLLLQRLGSYLIEKGDWKHAVKLYERALAARANAKETADDVVLRMEMGRLYHLLEDYKKAADCFARVLHALDHPKDFGLAEKVQKVLVGEPGPTYGLFGECFLLADRPQEAVAAFEKAHQLAPNKGLLQFHLAQVYARTGKPEMALASLEACFAAKLASEATAPHELLAEVLEKLGKKDELLPRLEKLRADDPKNVPLAYFLAGQYREADQPDKAESLYRALLQQTPTLTGYRSLIEIHSKANRTDALLAVLGELVEKTNVLDTLVTESQSVAKDADLLRGLVETARKKCAELKDHPEKLAYGECVSVALLAMESKQYETAAEFFDLAVKAKPAKAAELLLVWGVGLLVDERAAEAAKVFQRAIDQKGLADENPLFHFYLAGALAVERKTDEALAAARKAVAAKGDVAIFRSRVAWVLYRGKRNDEAVKAYTELIDKFGADYGSAGTRDVLREARLALSGICVVHEQLPAAEEWLEQVLDEFPDDVGASNDLGYLWADQGKRLERALGMIRLAVDAEPDNVAYRDSLGWIFYRLGRFQEAVVELEKAAAGRADATILDHLGDACLKANQPQKAKDAWRRAVEELRKEKDDEKAKQMEKKIQDSK